MIESGYSEMVSCLKRFKFDVVELNPEDTVSGHAGFTAVKDGCSVRYDGELTIDGDKVFTPWGEYDIDVPEHIQWFLDSFPTYFNKVAAKSPNRGNINGAI